jgi:hypothetical protein
MTMSVTLSTRSIRHRLSEAGPVLGDLWQHQPTQARNAMPGEDLIQWVSPIATFAVQSSQTSPDQFDRAFRVQGVALARLMGTVLLLDHDEVPRDPVKYLFPDLIFFIINNDSIRRVVKECGQYSGQLTMCDQMMRSYRAVVNYTLLGGKDRHGKLWSLAIPDLAQTCAVAQSFIKQIGSWRSQLWLAKIHNRAEAESKQIETGRVLV